jgi:prepilin-type N-terminal cleavage/methylation domain-containing protein
MLSKLKKSNGKGFTIIEVMIVLAIAGLILLIVLLAVPALQRSARNTQRKNDASSIASAISNSINDNNGTVPGGLGADSNAAVLDVCATPGASIGHAPGGTACGTGSIENATLGYYKPTAVFLAAGNPAGGTLAPLPKATGGPSLTVITSEQVVIITGYNCGSAAGSIGTPSTRTAAIFYVTEGSANGGAGNRNCVEQ